MSLLRGYVTWNWWNSMWQFVRITGMGRKEIAQTQNNICLNKWKTIIEIDCGTIGSRKAYTLRLYWRSHCVTGGLKSQTSWRNWEERVRIATRSLPIPKNICNLCKTWIIINVDICHIPELAVIIKFSHALSRSPRSPTFFSIHMTVMSCQ